MTERSEPVLKSHRRPEDVSTTVVEVGNVRFGDGSYPVIAGPVAVESEEQILAVALSIASAGASMLRGGTYRAENSPYGFRGLGLEGLWHLEHAGYEAGLPTLTEVIEHRHVEDAAHHADMLEVGPDNMQNFSLLKDVGKARLPVMLHRGPSATIDEWLMAAEYIMSEGNEQVVLCERGSRGFDPRTTETVDISAVPVVQRISHLPVIVAPAPAHGGEDLIAPLAMAVRSVGADGLSVFVHPDPAGSRAGNGSQLDLGSFSSLMERLGIPSLRDEIDRIDREIVRLLARRLQGSVEIGRIKVSRGLPLHAPDREAELIGEAVQDAQMLGVDPEYIAELMTIVLRHSRKAQHAALDSDDS